MDKERKSGFVAMHGLLIALALIFSYVEAQVPVFFAVPGMKLGLTNLVVLCALYLYGEKSALLINVLRIFLVAVLFGNAAAFLYSLSGGILSFLVMVLLKRVLKVDITQVSIAGGIAHNAGQILAAMVLLKTSALAYYIPVLWISGTVSGFLIGFLAGLVLKRLVGGK